MVKWTEIGKYPGLISHSLLSEFFDKPQYGVAIIVKAEIRWQRYTLANGAVVSEKCGLAIASNLSLVALRSQSKMPRLLFFRQFLHSAHPAATTPTAANAKMRAVQDVNRLMPPVPNECDSEFSTVIGKMKSQQGKCV